MNFEIVKTDLEYPIVIYSLSYVSPLGKIPVIEKKLESYKGKVLFDLLLSNGFASNRYIEAEFNEGKFLTDSFRAVEPDIKTKKESSSFYLKDPSLLDNGILHNPQKFLFKKGKIL
ncbi:type II toxin-antitoxin system RnlB family antitoxin [Bacillus cereus]|nr:type II toxin-antitoxin system RnlB family antitoxin [Bacillus cereus]